MHLVHLQSVDGLHTVDHVRLREVPSERKHLPEHQSLRKDQVRRRARRERTKAIGCTPKSGGRIIWVAVKGQLKKGKGKGSKAKAKEKGKNRQRSSAEERTRRRKGKGKHRGEDRHEAPSYEDPRAEDLESVEIDDDDDGDDGDGGDDGDDGGGGEENTGKRR